MFAQKTRVAAGVLRVVPRKQLSRFLGHLADVPVPRPLLDRAIRLYSQAYAVDMSEAEVPVDGFRSFDEFFTRRLKDGARPIATGDDIVASPADGRIEDAGWIREDSRLTIKGQSYSIAELLGVDVASPRSVGHGPVGPWIDPASFHGGQFSVVYLSPSDYHRVHAPVDGSVVGLRHVGGTLYPVNEIGLRHVKKLFSKNERVAIHQIHPTYGSIVTVLVGAIVVGRIGVAFEPSVETNRGGKPSAFAYNGNAPQLCKGDELGVFHLGSTAIVFTSSKSKLHTKCNVGARVRMGEPLLQFHD